MEEEAFGFEHKRLSEENTDLKSKVEKLMSDSRNLATTLSET
jgi:hypothetical protein